MFSVRIRWYIRRLKSKDRDVRKAAAEALGKEGIGDNASSNKDSIYLFYSNSNTITA